MKDRRSLATLDSEPLWALGLAAGVVALTFAPYIVGWLRQTPETIFGGILFNSIDANAYLAIMQGGRRGEWLLRLPFSAESHAPLFLYEFYILLGQFSAWTRAPVIAVYHLARAVGGMWALWAAYEYLCAHILESAARRVAYVLVCTGSGFGWLTQALFPAGPGGISPIDFWLMDAYVFFSVLLVPHFAFAWGLALYILTALGRTAFEFRRYDTAAQALVCGLGLTVVHPKLAPAIGIVASASAILAMWRRPDRRQPVLATLAAAGVGMLIPAAYYVYASQSNPVFVTLARQDITMSPPFVFYVLGYGVVGFLAVLGAWKSGAMSRAWLMIVWPAMAALMLYAPVQIQRRFVLGLQVPLAGLAGMGLVNVLLPALRRWAASQRISRWYSPRRLRLLFLNVMFAFAGLSNWLLVAGYSLAAWERSPSMFVSSDLAEAADWLGANAGTNDLTLTAYPSGNYLPARSGARTCIGHWNLTIDFYAKQEMVARIFDNVEVSTERERLIRAMGCRYLLYGSDERALGSFDPATAPFLVNRFSAGDTIVYEVLP